MAEVKLFETEQEGVETVEENPPPATEEANLTNKTKGAEHRGDDSDSVTQPLLQHQDSRDESRRADVQTATDGADRVTSVPQELGSAGRDQAGCSGSVRSLCSDNSSSSSRRECPICSELFDSHGDHCLTLLNCNHALCHRCTAGIMSRAKDTSRLRCPFCRQNTPFPQWEIRRLQEESYSDGVYQPVETLVIHPGPEFEDVPASPLCCLTLERQLEAQTTRNMCGCCTYPSCLVRGLRVLRLHSLCFSMSAILLLFLVLLGYFLYMIVPLITLSILFNNG